MHDDSEILDEIRSHISVEALFREYNVDTTKIDTGKREISMKCPLPGHDDAHPSFSINTASLRYQCHGCGRSGDLFSFVAEQEGLSCKSNFKEVITRAASIAGIPLNLDGEVNRASYDEIRRILQKKVLASNGLKDRAAKNYLERKGVDIRELNIAWGAEEDKGIGTEIIVPMLSPDLKGVWIGGQRGRKKVLAGSHLGIFYNPEEVKERGDSIFVVEGLSDYLSMLAAGFRNVIGLASATMRTKNLAEALGSYKEVLICLDLDKHKTGDDNRGGLVGAKKMVSLAERIDKKTTNVKLYELGGHHKFDLNDLYRENGKAGLINFFKNHIKSINQMSTETGLSSNPDAYSCARLFIKRFDVAVDAGVRHQWVCDPATNVWKSTKKNEVEDMVRGLIESVRSTGHTTKMIGETVRYISMLTAESIKKLDEKISTGGLITIDPNDLENSVNLCLKDGKYYPFTGKFLPYKPEDYVYSTLAVAHNDIKEYADMTIGESRFMSFLREILEGEDDRKERIAFIQEWFGYVLLPTNIFEKFLVIQGEGGNGKSTLLECLGEIVGDGNFTNMELSELTQSRFASSHLLGAYVNLCAEGDRSNVFDTPELKKITGGDLLTAERKFSDPFQFRPFCKIIIATNPDPTVSEDADWLKRRMQMIRFKQTFVGREDFFLKDILRKEQPIIFAWAIKGLMRLLKNKNFTKAPSVEETTSAILKSADTITPFINHLERINRDVGMRKTETLNAVYREFCDYMELYEGRLKKYIPTKRRFVADMIKKGFKLTEINKEYFLKAPKIKEAEVDLNDFRFDDD